MTASWAGSARRLSGQMADLARSGAGQRVLDVGCGTGALTGELVARLGPGGWRPSDPSEPFVAATRARHPGVDVRQARAEVLPFPDGAFDATLAQLVVHFMKDPIAGLTEMGRVTRPDGVVAACVWDHGGSQGPLRLFWDAARAWTRTSTTSLTGPARARASWRSCSRPQGCATSRVRPCRCDVSMRPSRPGGSRSRAA